MPELFDGGFHAGAGSPNVVKKDVGGIRIDFNGRAYSRIVIINPFIHAIDMLSFDYSQPVAQSQTFRVIFKYSNIDYQFIDMDDE